MRARLFGDSHVDILDRGWKVLAKTVPATAEISFYGRHGLNWLDPDVVTVGETIKVSKDIVAGSVRVDYVVDQPDDLYIFSSLLHSAPTYRSPVWRKFCPWKCAVTNPELHSVSDAALEAWVSAQSKSRFALLEKMQLCGYRIAVIEPPRPLKRAPSLHSVGSDVLLAADGIHRRFVRRWMSERQIGLIETPESTYDERGFTLDSFSAETPQDPHHGNTSFGVEAMKKVLQYVELRAAQVW